MRASGVFAIGAGIGRAAEDDEEGAAEEDGRLTAAVGGGGGVELVPCIAFSIQFVIWAALSASELGSWVEGSSW